MCCTAGCQHGLHLHATSPKAIARQLTLEVLVFLNEAVDLCVAAADLQHAMQKGGSARYYEGVLRARRTICMQVEGAAAGGR